jgi:hypothetical protein
MPFFLTLLVAAGQLYVHRMVAASAAAAAAAGGSGGYAVRLWAPTGHCCLCGLPKWVA